MRPETRISPSPRGSNGLALLRAAGFAAGLAVAMSLAGPAAAQGLSVKGGDSGAAGLGTRPAGSSLYGLSSPGSPSLGISSPDVAPSPAADAPAVPNARAAQASAASSAGKRSSASKAKP